MCCGKRNGLYCRHGVQVVTEAHDSNGGVCVCTQTSDKKRRKEKGKLEREFGGMMRAANLLSLGTKEREGE